jgi:hypothetical protein
VRKRSKNRLNSSEVESDASDVPARTARGSGVTSGKWLPLDELVEPDPSDDDSLDPATSTSDAGSIPLSAEELPGLDGNVGLEDPAADIRIKKPFERLVFTVEPEHANLRIDLYLTLKIKMK